MKTASEVSPWKCLIYAAALNNEGRDSWVGGRKQVWGNTAVTTERQGERGRYVEAGIKLRVTTESFCIIYSFLLCVCVETLWLKYHDFHSHLSKTPRGTLPHFTWKEAWEKKKAILLCLSTFHYFKCFKVQGEAISIEGSYTLMCNVRQRMMGKKGNPWLGGGTVGKRIYIRSGTDFCLMCRKSEKFQPSLCPWYDLTRCTHVPTSIYTYIYTHIHTPQHTWKAHSDSQLSPLLMSISGWHRASSRIGPARSCTTPSPLAFIAWRVWTRTLKCIPSSVHACVC